MNHYELAAAALLKETGCTLRRHRSGNSGVAYVGQADWGIEAPRPRGPISFAVFAHEVAHHVLHRTRRPRWLEEIEAEEYALAQFDRFDLPGVERARAKAAKHLARAACKAERRCSPETARLILDRYQWVWDELGETP